MAEMTEDQKKEMRSLVESFRDASLRNLKNWPKGPQGQVDTYGVGEELKDFVAYDTWLKLDAAEQAKKARKPNGP